MKESWPPRRTCAFCEYFDGGGELRVRSAQADPLVVLHGDCLNNRSPRFTTDSTDNCCAFVAAEPFGIVQWAPGVKVWAKFAAGGDWFACETAEYGQVTHRLGGSIARLPPIAWFPRDPALSGADKPA